ncbi:MAG: sensor domain-containing diguanylate cyclase [Angelakisella sp.]|nr:sensor domain-containing diguanylate cyclase [Angelakisella sp.]
MSIELRNQMSDNTDSSLIRLLDYKEMLNVALKASKICVFAVDLQEQLYTFFENSEDIFGVTPDKVLSDVTPYSKLSPVEYQKAVSEYFSHPDDWKVIDQAFKEIFAGRSTTYQARMRAGGSNYIWCKLDVSPVMENGVPVRMIGVITDITDIKSHTESLEKKANLDTFTGVYNKKHTEVLIQNIMKKEPEKKHGLLLLDIDDFKLINDNYGHTQGDQVLLEVAQELKTVFRKTDVVGRFGGDEFIIFLRDIPSESFLIEKARQLLAVSDKHHKITKSVGAAMYPVHGKSFLELFDKADLALYRAKQTKNTYCIYSPSCSNTMNKRTLQYW